MKVGKSLINPYVRKGYSLCDEALQHGYLALTREGDPYFVDFGEFFCGIVDFTNEQACQWFKKVIQKNLIEFGLSGWMADFGEYLPTDVVLHSKLDPQKGHNMWPGLWAKINAQAIEESGCDDILFFMRAGDVQSLRYCPMMWAGDQNVDWSEDDGLPSALTGALSLAMSGMGLHHSDIGGYTTLFHLRRTRELFLRWAEFAVFTPMMRTHEGNRPQENHQFDSDELTLTSLARLSRLFVALKPYRIDMVKENSEQGYPVMRPLLLHYPEKEFFNTKDCYTLGRDLLVAPVMEESATVRSLVLPIDQWVHLFTGKEYSGGQVVIESPLGYPPVFYRKESSYRELFSSITQEFGY